MIVILKHGVKEEKRDQLISWFKAQGFGVDISKGDFQTLLGLIGDTANLDTDLIESLDIVQATRRVTETFKRANRKFHPEDSIVSLAENVKVGGGNFAVMAGPGSLENEEQVVKLAAELKAAGANILCGGSVRSRTVSYSYHDQSVRDLELLDLAKKETGMPIAKEVLSVEDLPLYENVDLIIVGGRNMQNYPLLAELGTWNKPIMIKRAVSGTLEELLMSAEYVMVGGNKQIILCERGIRTFSDYTRSTLDLSAVPMLKELSHLPVMVDPSRGTGLGRLSRPMSRAAAAAGADGLFLEVHNDPAHAAFYGMQAVTPEEFGGIMQDVTKVREVLF